jgi:signal transduction histidine kinase
MADAPAHPALAAARAPPAATTRRSVRSLRSLLVEIYPPNLDQVGLAGAVADLAAAAGSAGTQVEVSIAPGLVLPEDTTAVVYRATREALSNVRRHAQATRAQVRVAPGPAGGTVLEVTDDGVGFDPDTVGADHMGLRLLHDLAAGAGGELTLDAAPGRGTRLRLVLP